VDITIPKHCMIRAIFPVMQGVSSTNLHFNACRLLPRLHVGSELSAWNTWGGPPIQRAIKLVRVHISLLTRRCRKMGKIKHSLYNYFFFFTLPLLCASVNFASNRMSEWGWEVLWTILRALGECSMHGSATGRNFPRSAEQGYRNTILAREIVPARSGNFSFH
jgi:hypothetical protein